MAYECHWAGPIVSALLAAAVVKQRDIKQRGSLHGGVQRIGLTAQRNDGLDGSTLGSTLPLLGILSEWCCRGARRTSRYRFRGINNFEFVGIRCSTLNEGSAIRFDLVAIFRYRNFTGPSPLLDFHLSLRETLSNIGLIHWAKTVSLVSSFLINSILKSCSRCSFPSMSYMYVCVECLLSVS